jgi:hypothetical protein
MAASQHIHFSATLLDKLQIKATKTSQLFVDPAQTLTATATAMTAWLTALDAITDSQIVRASVGIPIVLPGGLKATPAATAENSEAVTFSFDQAALTTHYGDNIPSFIVAGLSGDTINLANAAVAAYVALLSTPPVLGGGYSGLGNELLGALYRAFQGDRKHRKQLFAKSVTYP